MSIAIRASMDVLHSCPFVASLAAFVVSPPVVPTPVLVDSVFVVVQRCTTHPPRTLHYTNTNKGES
jgi:hypothetical protein